MGAGVSVLIRGKVVVSSKKDGCAVGGADKNGPLVNVILPVWIWKCSLGRIPFRRVLAPCLRMRQMRGQSLQLGYCKK